MPRKRPPRQLPLSLATMAVQEGVTGAAAVPGAPVVEPLVQSVIFGQEVGSAEGLIYPRYGNTPNAAAVQRRIAHLEGAEAAVLLSSGMGATACALLALLRPGDHLLASGWVYGGTRQLLTQEFASLGIEVTLVDPLEPRVWRKRKRKETRAIFLESPVNPTCRVLDLAPVSRVAHESGMALVVDSTFASPVNIRPLSLGADVVIHSATKYLNGHHDMLGGVVCGTEAYVEEVRRKMMLWGQAPDPFAAWLLDRGLKTLDVRVQRQNESSLEIAEWLASREDVLRVHHPGLPSHPDHLAASAMMSGYGGMLAVELHGGEAAADRFLRRLRLFRHAPSLGGVESLISEPRFTSHAHLTSEERAKAGFPDGFLRLSVGVEAVKDLIADLEQALEP